MSAAVHQLPVFARRVRAGHPVPPENERLSNAIAASFAAGIEQGERQGYKAGVRWGMATWLSIGFIGGGLTVAGLIKLGQALGVAA